MARRPTLAVLALAVLALVVALPVVAADPSAPPGPGRGKSDKAHTEKTPVTLAGTLSSSTVDGAVTYTLQSGGTTYTLEAGPPWFLGDKNPLKGFVGKTVTISGERAEGSTEIDVTAVNGQEIRAGGKPPWAGGWKRVGEGHPGWSQEKADRFKAKFGDCFPPGQCRSKAKDATP